jgi:hypothetical protein
MSNPKKFITMTIDAPSEEGGFIPLKVLSKKFDTLQNILFNIAEIQSGEPAAYRGNRSRQIRSACMLLFSETRKGSLTIIAELPPHQETEHINTAPDELKNIGIRALNGLKQAARAVVSGDLRKIAEVLPDSAGRVRFLKSLEGLCPRESDGFAVILGDDTEGNYAEFTPESRSFIKSCFTNKDAEESPEVQTICGVLIEIRAFAGNSHISVRSRQREIRCYYPSDTEDQIAQLVTGSVVEVTGVCQIGDDGFVNSIYDISDINTVDLNPFRINSFMWDNKKFILKEPVICNIDFEGDLWIYKVPRYELHAFAADRREAFAQLGEFFASNCEELLYEKDENLTLDAIELRERIKTDLKEIKEIH